MRADFESTAENQFLIRSEGGMWINTNDTLGIDLRVNDSIGADKYCNYLWTNCFAFSWWVMQIRWAGNSGGINLLRGDWDSTRLYLKEDHSFYLTRNGDDNKWIKIEADGSVHIQATSRLSSSETKVPTESAIKQYVKKLAGGDKGRLYFQNNNTIHTDGNISIVWCTTPEVITNPKFGSNDAYIRCNLSPTYDICFLDGYGVQGSDTGGGQNDHDQSILFDLDSNLNNREINIYYNPASNRSHAAAKIRCISGL